MAAAQALAAAVGFKARKSVSIPFREQAAFPARDYLKRVDRIVTVAFPDSSRIRYLGDGAWQSRLKPITFFTLSATPVCEIRVFYDESTRALHLRSNKMLLEFLGVPQEMQSEIDFQFSLAGDLRVSSSPSRSNFHGSVSLGLDSDLPLPFSLMPDVVLKPVGDGILDRILEAMQGALLQGLVSDYTRWCQSQQRAQVRP